ncbi:4-diphosphocytidyl-2-C-methyl-D-erythritol kinase [Blastopirellula retiformator]|uniref:4-diphosphocytidyl-2-C-methyl-D-erythritol kinase n=2 Tax=Blastopirellula retiformator TaxID=2527970 RepID=A0A5C5V840_9BACT|nr:4-diphosphocytidyl-2-C-methyl-D-erythritol kinase [Blastopirellula retiformator]
MIQRPALRLTLDPAEQFSAAGPTAGRIREFAQRWSQYHRQDLPPVSIRAIQTPRQHVGLGLGTQLGLGVATLLNCASQIQADSIAGLAASVGRGARSAVGCYGFDQGGFIAERGMETPGQLSPLEARMEFPAGWTFLLVFQSKRSGISGPAEVSAFRKLPPVPLEVTAQLKRFLYEELTPALQDADFDRFADGLFRYGELAGNCFVQVQGGAYLNQLSKRTVDALQHFGVRGVGQSSWGPTIFALCKSKEQAAAARDYLSETLADEALEMEITAADNQGAQLIADADCEWSTAAENFGVTSG